MDLTPMKRFLLVLALLLVPSLAWAQCNGVFPANTICGNATGTSALPKPTSNSVLTGVPGGSNGQVQFNNSGAFGGLTNAQLATQTLSGANATAWTALINSFTSSLAGAAPASGGGTINFLRADGAWATPSSAPTPGATTPQSRITLTSATPVMSSSVAGATTVFVTPFVGSNIPIYDGVNFTSVLFPETSQATVDTTKSPAAVANNSIYDIFCWVDTGPTNRCTRGPAWTNDTTRSAGTALVSVNGVFLNNATITNGPAASRGTYIGSIRSNGTATIDFIYGAVGAGGTAANFSIWNAYNRVPVNTFVGDSTDSWTYAIANTWRAPNGSATMRINSLRGLNIDGVSCTYYAMGNNGAATNMASGVGLDSTTAFTGITVFNNAATNQPLPSTFTGFMGLGYHFCTALEFNTTTTASTWFGDAGTVYLQTGLAGVLWQ